MGYGPEHAQLARGDSLRDVMGSAFGWDSAGRAVQALAWQLLEQLPTGHSRRQVLGHFLRTFEAAQLHGSQWRVIDAAAYVGHDRELAPEVLEVIDPESGEVLERDTGRMTLQHCPSKRAGGLAAREDRSPRTLRRYRGVLRDAQPHEDPADFDRGRRRPAGPRALMNSSQPKFDASDAVRPTTEGACWAYAQHWLTFPPSPEMLARWGVKRARSAPLELGSRELPRLPSAPEQLSRVLDRLRER